MEKKKFELIVKISSILSACLIFSLAIIAIAQFIKIGAVNRKKAKIQNQLNYVAEQKYDLETAIKNQQKLDNAEKYAREELGFIEDGDIIYTAE